MKYTQIQKMKLKNTVEQVLHIQGNYRGGILEMAMVFDASFDKEELQELAAETAAALKSQGPLFRNVRLNTILWNSDTEMIKAVTPLPFLQMGTYFTQYKTVKTEKHLEILAGQLKKFYARSKVILLFASEELKTGDEKMLQSEMKPFLEKKLIYIRKTGDVQRACIKF